MAYPNTTKQKIPLVYPHSMSVKGVDGKFDLFPPVSGFRRSGAECVRLHRHHFLPSKFIDLLELETHPSDEPEGILRRFFVFHVPMAYHNITKKNSPLVYPLLMSVKGVDGKFEFFPPGFGFRRSGALEHRNPTKT